MHSLLRRGQTSIGALPPLSLLLLGVTFTFIIKMLPFLCKLTFLPVSVGSMYCNMLC